MVTVRLTEDEHALCVAAADKGGQQLGAWTRDRLLAAAKRAR